MRLSLNIQPQLLNLADGTPTQSWICTLLVHQILDYSLRPSFTSHDRLFVITIIFFDVLGRLSLEAFTGCTQKSKLDREVKILPSSHLFTWHYCLMCLSDVCFRNCWMQHFQSVENVGSLGHRLALYLKHAANDS